LPLFAPKPVFNSRITLSQYLITTTTSIMALPHFLSLEDCADWSKTVEPFLPQLYELPQRVLDHINSPHDLLELYKQTNPLVSGFAFSLFAGVVFLVVSEANRNWSQVDRMWSLLPTMYNAHFKIWAHMNNVESQRLNLVLLWSCVWSVSNPDVNALVITWLT
jgi:hypothetical protein